MDLLVRMLAFIVVCICQSVSHEDGAKRNPQSYATVNKKFISKNFVHLDRKRIEAHRKNIENFEIMRNNEESFWLSMSFLFAKTSTNAKLRYSKKKLSLMGPHGSDEADNNTGTCVACGRYI